MYFAVKICQRDTFPSATLTFMVWKIFGNRQKHQRRRSAWVGQADFGKLGLNNRNHSENCHHLSLNSKQKIYAIKLNSAQDTIHHSSPVFFGGSAEYSQYMYFRGQSYSPEEAPIESPSQNSSALVVSGARRTQRTKLTQVRRLLLLRKDGCTRAGRTTKK